MRQTDHPEPYITFLRRLRAVRQFRSEPLEQEALDAILEVARWSGSAGNRQHWELVVIQEEKTLQALAQCEGYAKHVAGAAVGIVLVMAGSPERVEQETYDEGRLSERIMLAAQAYGIGSCIGWLRGEGSRDAKTLLGIPQERLVRTVLSLGYPDEEARRARHIIIAISSLSRLTNEPINCYSFLQSPQLTLPLLFDAAVPSQVFFSFHNELAE